MKTFIGKTQEEALELAANELNVPVENIYVDSVNEIKGLFGRIKNVEITCYTDAMVVEFVQDYLRKIIEHMGIEVKMNPSYNDGLIRIKLSTNHNSILIGKDGETLQALNEVCRNAANATFKKRVRILLDINEYKQEKYAKFGCLPPGIKGLCYYKVQEAENKGINVSINISKKVSLSLKSV